jgi:hypothetical protein
MKARVKGSADPFREVKQVCLENSDILYNVEVMEFEHDTLSTELKTSNQIDEEKHWQNIREQAAIAAMQGLLADTRIEGTSDDFARSSVEYADALVEQLKKKKQ